MMRFRNIIAAMAFVAVVTGGPIAMAEKPMEPFVIDLLLGEPIPMETLLDDLVTVRIIYLGEIHTIGRHHAVQAELLRGLAERGLKLSLGMEMFTIGQQAALDRWQQGRDGIDALKKELGHDFWTNLHDYELVLLSARECGIPIIGLNASSGLVRKVAREGLQGLSEEEHSALPEGIDRINPLNDRLLRIRLKVHRAFQEKSLDNIVLAQAVRDETMARAVARYLTSDAGKDRGMVVIAGNGHVNYGFGIPESVQRRLDVPYRIIVSSESGELVLSEEEKRQAVPVAITHEDLKFIRVPIADYLQVIPLKKDQE